ncbi:MAG TPA: hypothetical protein PL066_04165 [bacterium]|nr:hypothetical protein [bacterium]
MNKFSWFFIALMIFSFSACGFSKVPAPNPEALPPATNVPSGEAPNIPEELMPQPPVDGVAPGGFPVGGGAPAVNNPPLNEAPIACTMDAKICPDGSAVGRTAPDCEFAPCPGESAQKCDSCPMLSQPSPSFCEGGIVVEGETTECGCQGVPKCLK